MKTGSAPQCLIAFAEAINEWLTVITTSPGLTPTARRAICKAAVQLETAQANSEPTYDAKAFSNS